MPNITTPDVRTGAARKARYYAAPCDDENGRTWDVLDRERFTDSDSFVVEQCLPTRAAARAAAKRWNAGAQPGGYFVDPETGDRLPDDEKWDAEGEPIIGSDDDGTWWGTERAAWVLREWPSVCIVYGWMGPDVYVGYFVGPTSEAREYAETHGVIVDHEIDAGIADDELTCQ